MKPNELIDNLVTKENYHKVVDICLKEGYKIPKKCLPEINIYQHTDGNDIRWERVFTGGEWTFIVDGNEYRTLNDFFTHYQKITDFIKNTKVSKTIYKVVPNIVGGNHWYRSPEHYEIAYNCHSYGSYALTEYRFHKGKEYIYKNEYFIDGDHISDYKKWLMLSREYKLSRICGVDLKKERETVKTDWITSDIDKTFLTCA